jgi:hypothetical protein
MTGGSMKKIISVFLCAVIMLPLPAAAADSEFTTADALLILRAVAGLATLNEAQTAKYDFNNNSSVTTANALFVLKIVAGVEEPPKPALPALSAQEERRVISDYVAHVNRMNSYPGSVNITASEIEYAGYLGTHNGYKAVMLGISSAWNEPYIEVYNFEGIEFAAKGHLIIFLYKDSSFIALGDAYDQRLINYTDVRNILLNSNLIFPVPPPREIPPPLVPLTRQTEQIILGNFEKYAAQAIARPETFVSDVAIRGYLGTYYGWEAVAMWYFLQNSDGSPRGGHGASPQFRAANLDFRGIANVYLHKDSSFISIVEAYAEGLINYDDVYKIHYYWTQVEPEWYQRGGRG